MNNSENKQRQILHFDIDAFFASVEQYENPDLRGKPIMIGGDSDRGVVATCSYEARKYGVRSAMSIVVAKKLCPEGIIVYPRMGRYKEISNLIFEYVRAINCKIERVSIDEAYLDITALNVDPRAFAHELKEAVKAISGMTISVGISYNKFLAKLASDWNKPDGIFEIKSDEIPQILLPLPIIKVHGLGKKSVIKLNRIGIFTIGDLMNYPVEALKSILGTTWAEEIIQRIHGHDERPVEESESRKSYGRETTLKEDSDDRELIYSILKEYFDKILSRLKQDSVMAKTLTIKVKYCDFEQFTKSHSIDYHTNSQEIWMEYFDQMFNHLVFEKKVRLIGLTFSNFETEDYKQYNLLELL